jgi:hydroxymethylbilane synthase
MRLEAAWGDPGAAGPDGIQASLPAAVAGQPAPLVRVQHQAQVRNFAEAEALGDHVAAMLRAGGAVWASNASA